MLTKQQQRDVERAAAAVAAALVQAVEATLAQDSPQPARETIMEILGTGLGAPTPEGDNPAAVVTTYLLLSWLTLVREALADQPDRVAEILGWVEEHLGKRCRLRARYTAVALAAPEGVDEIAEYARGLGADFMPSILWLIAGAVGRYGDGDVGWLERIVTPFPPPPSGRR